MYALGVDRKSYPALPTWHRLVARPQSPSKPANWQLAFCSATDTSWRHCRQAGSCRQAPQTELKDIDVVRYWKTQRLVFFLLFFTGDKGQQRLWNCSDLLPFYFLEKRRGGPRTSISLNGFSFTHYSHI